MVPWHPQCPIHVVVLCCHHLVHVDGQFREVEHDRKCLWFTYQDSDGEWHCSFKCLRCPNELSLRDALQLWGKAVLSFNSDEPPHCPVHGIRSLIIDMKQLVMANTFMCTNQVNVHEQPEIINDCRLSIPPFPLPIIDILDSPLDESEVGAAGTGAEVFNWCHPTWTIEVDPDIDLEYYGDEDESTESTADQELLDAMECLEPIDTANQMSAIENVIENNTYHVDHNHWDVPDCD